MSFCLNKESIEVKEILAKVPIGQRALLLHKMNQYANKYKTSELLNDPSTLFKTGVEGLLLSPFLNKVNLKKVEEFFKVKLKDNIVPLTLLYANYRKDIKETTETILDNNDLSEFYNFLNNSNSKLKELLPIVTNSNSTNVLVDKDFISAAYNITNPNIDNKLLVLFTTGPLFSNLFGEDIRINEGIDKIRKFEEITNTTLLNEFNLPKIYSGLNGDYMLNTSGDIIPINKDAIKLLAPVVTESVLGYIANNYFLAENPGNIIDYYKNTLKRVLSDDVDNKIQELYTLAENKIDSEIETRNLTISSEDRSKYIDKLLDNLPQYNLLIETKNLFDVYRDNISIQNSLFSLFKAKLKSVGWEFTAESKFTDENNNIIDVDDDTFLIDENSKNEAFDTSFDMLEPNVKPEIKKLFLGIVKQSDGLPVYSKYVANIPMYEDAKEAENKILNMLSGIVKPFKDLSNNILNEEDTYDAFEVMFKALKDNFKEAPGDYILGSVIENIESIIEKDDDTTEKFKTSFIDSFSLMPKVFSIAIASEKSIIEDNDISDHDYSGSMFTAILQNFNRLNENKIHQINSLLSGITTEVDKGRKKIDFSELEQYYNDIVDLRKKKISIVNLDPQIFYKLKNNLEDFFSIKLEEYEARDIIDSSLLKISTKFNEVELFTSNSKEKLSSILNDYINTIDKDTKKSKLPDFVSDKNKSNNIVGIISNVLGATSKFKNPNTFTVGANKRYPQGEFSFFNRVIAAANNHEMTPFEMYKDEYNSLVDYITGDDLLRNNKTTNDELLDDIYQLIFLRQKDISLMDNSAIKKEEGDTKAIKDTGLTDRIITNAYKAFNSNNEHIQTANSENKESVNNIDIKHVPIAGDGNTQLDITGIYTTLNNNTLLSNLKFYSLDDLGEIVTNDVDFRKLTFMKLLQVLNRTYKAQRTIQGYFDIDNMPIEGEGSINNTLRKFENKEALLALSDESKVKFLKRNYALNNLRVGYHYSTSKDLSNMDNQLEYKDFEAGIYHRGGHLNDVFEVIRKDNLSNVNNKSTEAFSNELIKYKYKDSSINSDILFPSVGDLYIANDLLTIMKESVNSFNFNNGFSDLFDRFPNLSELNEIVKDTLQIVVDNELEVLSKIPMWSEKDSENEDSEVIKTLRNLPLGTINIADLKSDKTKQKAIDNYYSNYVISHMLFTMEVTDMLTGGFHNFKQPKGFTLNTVDFNKRASAPSKETRVFIHTVNNEDAANIVYTFSGERIEVNRNNVITLAHFKNVGTFSSKFFKQIKEGNPLIRYYNIEDLADGQSYGTPAMHKFIRKAIKGAWTKEDEINHSLLMNPETKITKELLKWMKISGNGATGSSNKPFINGPFDIKKDNKTTEDDGYNEIGFMMLKTSIFFLYPAIVNNTDASKLLDAMESQGVDILANDSANKASKMESTTIHKVKETEDGLIYNGLKDYTDNVLDVNDNSFRLNPFFVPSSLYGDQQDVPTKGISEGEVPKQAVKNILANLDLLSSEKNYTFDGENFTAREIFNLITETGIDILQDQNSNFYNSIYSKDLFGEENVNDTSKIRNMIIKQLDPIKNIEEISLLKDLNIPMSTIPNIASKILPLISKFIDKRIAQVNTNKGSVVQVADMGFSTEFESGIENDILYLSDNKDLAPPVPVSLSRILDSDKNTVLNKLKEELVEDEKVYDNFIDSLIKSGIIELNCK